MIEDDDIVSLFVVESSEHLADIENQLLTIEAGGADIDVELVNTVFRGVHSIKGAAGFLGLTTINNLSHSLENVLNLIRERRLVPSGKVIDVLLNASDRLRQLIDNVHDSNDVDVEEPVQALAAIAEEPAARSEADSSENTSHTNTQQTAESKPALEHETSRRSKPIEPTDLAPVPPLEDSCQSSGTTSTGTPTTPTTRSAAAETPIRTTRSSAESSIRVPVETLDQLMNLAGELVLGRNQLLLNVDAVESKGLEEVASRISQVTSELQEVIMQTRMQPIGSVFSRFTRVVRDLSVKLGKDCHLSIEGSDVEVDKTILEAIGDPLTALIRNAVDHGLEAPTERVASGKPPHGKLLLRALHQSDKVRILIKDDGRGLNLERIREKAIEQGLLDSERAHKLSDRETARLIFAPGFSTAEKLSDVSGRGMGMDVVRTNIEKLGGTVEVESKASKGSTIEVTLPLTLAIIPSLIVSCQNERFAFPQSNIRELVRINPKELQHRIGKVKSAEVLHLRGQLLPLVRLSSVLGMPTSTQAIECDSNVDFARPMSIVVVDTGQQSYGVVVDELYDSEEIVVRPLGRHFGNCQCMSGATILGDGRVALILDVGGIAKQASLCNVHCTRNHDQSDEASSEEGDDVHSILVFRNHPREQFAVPSSIVARIERIQATRIDKVGGVQILQYGGKPLPLIALEDHIKARPREESEQVYVAVFDVASHEIGLIIPILEDIRNVHSAVDMVTLREQGVTGSLTVDDTATRLIDLFELIEKAHPEWFAKRKQSQNSSGTCQDSEAAKKRILLAEDSDFFREQVRRYLDDADFEIVEARNGLEAWNILQADPVIDIVVTDIQMPDMTGFELCECIKNDDATKHLPVVALTSLAGEEDLMRGRAVGFDEYQGKVDRERLLSTVNRLTLCQTVDSSTAVS